MAKPISFTVNATGLNEMFRSVSANQADANMRLLLLENRQRDAERQARETAKQHQQQLQQCETRLTGLITTLSATIGSSQQQSDLEARLTDLVTTLSAKIEEAALPHHQQPASDSQLTDNIHALLGRLDTVERLFRDHLRHNGNHLAPYPRMQSGRFANILADSNNGGIPVSSDIMAVESSFTHHGLTDTEDAALPVASLSTRPSLMFTFELPPQRLETASASRQEDHKMDCHMDDNADENVVSMSDDQSEVDMVPARQPSQGTTVSSANRLEEHLFRDQGEENSHLNCFPVESSLRSLSATQTDADPEIDELFNNIQVASHRARFYPSLARDSTTRNQNFRTNDDSIKNFKVRTHASQLDGRGVSNDLRWLQANPHSAGVKENIQGLTRSQVKRQRDVEDQDDTFVRPQARRPRPQSQPVHGPRRVFVDNQQQTEGLQPAAQVQTQVEPISLQEELPRIQSQSQPPEGQRR